MTKLARDYFTSKGWNFHLQGSRSKGFFPFTSATSQSDWDYYLDDDQHNRWPAYLHFIDDGWAELDKLSYQDASTTRIFEKTFPDGVVQISLRLNYQVMCEIWDNISDEFYVKYMNKRSPTYLGKVFVKDLLDMSYWTELKKKGL